MIAPAPGRCSKSQVQRCVFTMLPGDVSRSQAAEVEVNAEEDQHGQRNHGDSSRALCRTTAKLFNKDDRVMDLAFGPYAR